MNALLLRNLGGLRRASSLQSFAEYRQAEAQNQQLSSVTSEGTLIEYETLELRIHPPNVVIDNDTYDDMTVVTIDSANRPGTLIEVVQCLTELGLSIRMARISSDGGWFVDEFFVTETPKGKIIDQRKLDVIRKVLSVEADAAAAMRDKELCTVFELAGRDRHGLLAAVLQLLVVNGCEVLSAAVWTFHDRVALVISATERGAPVVDPVKLDCLERILYDMLGGGDAVVNSELVRGPVHHERRLHHLLLLEELKAWEQQYIQASTPPATSAGSTQNGIAPLVVAPTGVSTTLGGTGGTGSGMSSVPPGAEADGGAVSAMTLQSGFTTASGMAVAAATAAAGVSDGGAAAAGAGGAFTRISYSSGGGLGAVVSAAAGGGPGLPLRAPSPLPRDPLHGQGDGSGACAAPGVVPLLPHLNVAGSGGAAAAAAAGQDGHDAAGGVVVNGFTPAGFPEGEEGGAACPVAVGGGGSGSGGNPHGLTSYASGHSGHGGQHFAHLAHPGQPGAEGAAGGGFAAAPAGPFDCTLGVCGQGGDALLGGHPAPPLALQEPHIDVGLDLPAAVQIQDQIMHDPAVAAAVHRRLSVAGPAPGGDAAAGLPALLDSPAVSAAGLDGTAAAGAGRSGSHADVAAAVLQPSGASSGHLSAVGGSCGGAGGAPGAHPLPPKAPAARGPPMTATGDEGQLALAPAPTAAPATYTTTDGGSAVVAAPTGVGRPSTPPGGPRGAGGAPSAGGSDVPDSLAPLRRSEVRIQHSAVLNYWLVTIRCRDRNKLFFDTVCTLADMNYDIYHATIDSEGDAASQLFYVRPRYGECIWDDRRAAKLRYMLESAVQRRFPQGCKVCVQSHDRAALVQLFSALSSGGFWITRADVRTFHDSAVFEFSITDTKGQLPAQDMVQQICEAMGGVLVQDVYGSQALTPAGTSRLASGAARSSTSALASAAPAQGAFRFSILDRRWAKGWPGQGTGAPVYDHTGGH